MFQTSVICDKCSEKLSYRDNIHKNIMIMLARDHGWTMGKYHLFPNCKNRNRQIKKQV